MQALIEVSQWLESRLPLIRQIHLTRILEDQLTVMLAELSMFREARNQIQLRRNFAIRLYSTYPVTRSIHQPEPPGYGYRHPP